MRRRITLILTCLHPTLMVISLSLSLSLFFSGCIFVICIWFSWVLVIAFHYFSVFKLMKRFYVMLVTLVMFCFIYIYIFFFSRMIRYFFSRMTRYFQFCYKSKCVTVSYTTILQDWSRLIKSSSFGCSVYVNMQSVFLLLCLSLSLLKFSLLTYKHFCDLFLF